MSQLQPTLLARSNTVAVVDDDEDVRDVLAALLELCGHDVETYQSATEFLQQAVLDQFSCLVVDLNMPGLKGIELIAELESKGVAIPTLLITGASNADVRRRATRSGIMTVMQKPMSHHQLLRFVASSMH
jgi:FixJ family two-component response regulator